MSIEKLFLEKGFKREITYYTKNNLKLIDKIKYINNQYPEEVTEITFNLLGENKKTIDFESYSDDYRITLIEPSSELFELVLKQKEELGWT